MMLRKFRFRYLPDNPQVLPADGWAHSGYTNGKFTEYNGYETMAGSDAEAWEEFLDYSGEFGQPDARDYTCMDVTEE